MPTQSPRVGPRLDRQRRGAAAEVLAARHLRAQGLVVLARNVRCRGGEIDLLCRDGELLVVVEVRMRTRASLDRDARGRDVRARGQDVRARGLHDRCHRERVAPDFGGALCSVSAQKRRSLLHATRHVLLRSPALRRHRLRFDVVGIERSADGRLSLTWVRDAFRADG